MCYRVFSLLVYQINSAFYHIPLLKICDIFEWQSRSHVLVSPLLISWSIAEASLSSYSFFIFYVTFIYLSCTKVFCLLCWLWLMIGDKLALSMLTYGFVTFVNAICFHFLTENLVVGCLLVPFWKSKVSLPIELILKENWYFESQIWH